MLAINSVYVAITSIQSRDGNPYPWISALIVLAAQLFIPVLFIVKKYGLEGSQGSAVLISVITALSCVYLITRRAAGFEMEFGGEMGVRLKIISCLFVSTIAIVWLARSSPEAALILYFVYAMLPLQKMLRLPIATNG